jgi:GNAT superfamily N-acetyltransferase
VPPTLRLAEPADLDALAICQTACWREAFTGLVPQDQLDEPRYELIRRQDWADRLTAGIAVWLAEVDRAASEAGPEAGAREIVGFACGGASRDADAPTPLELYTLYTRVAMHGTGLADRLLQAAIGDAPASLWVWRDNARARAYYTRRGFAPDGATKTLGMEQAPMVRLVRPAPAP